MMLIFSVADLVTLYAYMVLLAAGLLLVPVCRRITLLRWTACGSLLLVGLLCVGARP